MIKNLLLTAGFLSYIYSNAQINIQNGSFEGPNPASGVPMWQTWYGSPDTQPGLYCVTLLPYDGNSYLGLIFLGGGAESIGQLLPSPIIKNQLYTFSVALSMSNSTVPNCGGFTPGPCAFQIWGAKTVGGRSELLWQSDTIDHAYWVEYQGNFIADSNYNYIRLEMIQFATGNYILVDKLSNFYEVHPEIWYTSTTSSILCSELLKGKTDSIATMVKLKSRYLDTLNATINATDTSWSASIDYSSIRNCGVRKDTIIALGYFANGYIAKDTLLVDINCQYDTCGYVPPTLELIIPNLITPNGDGQNEFFELINLPAKHEVQIYNRWGSRIYRSKAYQNNWQGEDGVYYFILILENKSYKGWVQVLR